MERNRKYSRVNYKENHEMAEIWDLYNKDKNLIGKIHERGKQLGAGEYHLVVGVWVVNEDGQILITKRHPSKIHGDLWEVPGGAVQAGEDSINGAKRELFEETGIACDDATLYLLETVVKASWIVDVYLLKKNLLVDQLKLQQEEVTDGKWVSVFDFEQMCSQKLIAPFVVDDYAVARNKILQQMNIK